MQNNIKTYFKKTLSKTNGELSLTPSYIDGTGTPSVVSGGTSNNKDVVEYS